MSEREKVTFQAPMITSKSMKGMKEDGSYVKLIQIDRM